MKLEVTIFHSGAILEVVNKGVNMEKYNEVQRRFINIYRKLRTQFG